MLGKEGQAACWPGKGEEAEGLGMGEASPEVPQPDAVPFQVEAELVLQLGGSAVQRRGGPSRPPAPGPASWWSVRVMRNGAWGREKG